jgi:hypothetical protein
LTRLWGITDSSPRKPRMYLVGKRGFRRKSRIVLTAYLLVGMFICVGET